MVNFLIIFLFYLIGCYLYEFYQEEKKKDKKIQIARKKDKNRRKFNIDIK
jgi:Na+-transporting methylmalonyl-CoA/oxaloacetate decarboxylase gamma subunit